MDVITCIAHGGTSPLKLAALRIALDRADQRVCVIDAEEVGSGVDAQPIGLDMAALGAENRAHAAREKGVYRAPIGIGIESSLTFVRGVWIDTATVALAKDGVLIGLTVSAGLAFPFDCVTEAIAAGVRYRTAGEVIAKRFGGKKDDPHSTLTKGRISRQALIADAIHNALISL